MTGRPSLPAGKANAGQDVPADPVTLAIDIGGSHVKLRTDRDPMVWKVTSGPEMSAAEMMAAIRPACQQIGFDRVSIGFPGQVVDHRIMTEPVHLGDGWVGFDFAAAFGRPVRIVNDALMQAIGAYRGQRMLFLGLGTGLGAALVLPTAHQPLEIGHLPFRKHSFEHYVGEAFRKRKGGAKWSSRVVEVIAILKAAMQADYILLGGGNADKVEGLPTNIVLGANSDAFLGGFRIWDD